MASKEVLVVLATGSEELEAIAVSNVLRRAGIEVTVASAEGDARTVTCARGTRIECDALLSEAMMKPGGFDMVVLPGGMNGSDRLGKHTALMEFLHGRKEKGEWYAAICAAPALALKPNGLFPKKGTCFPSLQDKIEGAEWMQGK